MGLHEKENCPNIYRKPGNDTVHCRAQADKGARWDFCKYQYFCRQSKRYEAASGVASCNLRERNDR